jgi:protein-disulfide isomerase
MLKIILFNLAQRLRLLVAILFATTFLSISLPVYAMPLLPELQNQVLQVIREHPQEILDTLVNYQEQQAQARSKQQSRVLEDYRQQPAKLIGQSPTLGKRGSGRIVVEFSDFQCPYCQKAHQDLQVFYQRHPDVQIVYKHLPLAQIHTQALPASQAAWAAAQQGQFWAYHDRLFEQQDQLDDALYQQIAKDLQLDLAQFEHDRHSETAQKAIQADLKIADRVGAQGTPLFLVITPDSIQRISGADISSIETAIEQA